MLTRMVRHPALTERLAAVQMASPLRRVDARVKLALGLLVSTAVMLPIARLLVVLALFAALLAWGRLLPVAGRLLWRLKWVLLVLFAFDWLLISLQLAIAVSLRIILLSASFAIVFATTTPEEFRLALEWLRLPYRYAFSLSLAVQSLGWVDREWRALVEAQRARGAWQPGSGWRQLRQQVYDLVALAAPAVVMTTHRAWSMTEAAYARGFDAPGRRSARRLKMAALDWGLLLGAVLAAAGVALWPA